MQSHWQTLTRIKDEKHDLSQPDFDTLNGDPFPEHQPESKSFPKFRDSVESEGEIDTPHEDEIPNLAPETDGCDSSSSSDSDDSDDDDEHCQGMSRKAAKRAVRHSKGTLDEGTMLKPNHSQGLTCCADADFAGNWTSEQALDPRACPSRTGCVMFHANCPMVWHSELQSTVSLSTTEAEHVALSAAARDVICFINLIQEIQDFGIELPSAPSPKATCRIFEDNVGALELANTHKLRPRTKHLAAQLHHFRQRALDKKVLIEKIATTHQRADIFAKALPCDAFRCL